MNTLPHLLLTHPLARADIVRADGARLCDSTGRQYLDFESGIWCTSLGHNHPSINRCIEKQLKEVAHLGIHFLSPTADRAAAELLNITTLKDGKALFLSSGSEAVELGIRLARICSGKFHLITFTRSYLGAYGAAGRNNKTDSWVQVDIDECLRCTEDNCTDSCPQLKNINFDRLAAFVMEPVLASGGIIIPPKKVVQYLAAQTKKGGGFVVDDEVTTGLGRTGRWLGSEHCQIRPDIIVFGKTLGNGYPISAVAMSSAIADQIQKSGLYYYQSHQNDPLGCAVAGEVVRTLTKEKLVERAETLGEYMQTRLHLLKDEFEIIKDVRGVGLMAGMEIKPEYAGTGGTVDTIAEMMLEKGFIIGTKSGINILRFFPPYIISKKDIDGMVESLSDILKDKCREGRENV
jgi:acetylornithine aminotransferase